jgi:hypothetical protein
MGSFSRAGVLYKDPVAVLSFNATSPQKVLEMSGAYMLYMFRERDTKAKMHFPANGMSFDRWIYKN